LDEVRKNLGFCCQKDILYEELTVDEHLKYICEIKQLSKNFIEGEINFIVEKVGLTAERKKKINELSGGNKRKLSLGMALVAGSKIIFLDEPTSGMDPNTRRTIWEIMKKIKGDNR
jgi:ATP-binding cassette subfamily A (ABC1) protein 3